MNLELTVQFRQLQKYHHFLFSASEKSWSLLWLILHKFTIHGTTSSLMWFSWSFIYFLFNHLITVFLKRLPEMPGGFQRVCFSVTLLFAVLQNSKELLLFWIIKQIAVKLTVRKLCRQRSTYIYLIPEIFRCSYNWESSY